MNPPALMKRIFTRQERCRRVLLLLAVTWAAASAVAQTPQAEPPPRPSVESTSRGGLANFFTHAEAGGPVNVAYLGGSITAQVGWRVQSLAWLQKRYPRAKFQPINAAIGGTGAELGAFRLKTDVLQEKPDLLFVEFAVNDAYTARQMIVRAMEGIVRQTWQAYPNCDIVFVYTLTLRETATYQGGKFPKAVGIMEEVADHYGIPSVALGLEVAQLEKEGKLMMSSPDAHMERVSGDELNQVAQPASGPILFSKDGVHPYLDTGHLLYTQALIRGMESIRSVGKTAGPHHLGEPLAADNLENARVLVLDRPEWFTGEAVKLDPAADPVAAKFARRLPAMWKLGPGAQLRFRFKGTKAAIYGLFAPDSGVIEVTLDGTSRKQPLFDSYTSYPRLGVFFVGDKLADAEHEVTVKVLDEWLDKESILSAAGKKSFQTNPDPYKGCNAYLGQIFFTGEIHQP